VVARLLAPFGVAFYDVGSSEAQRGLMKFHEWMQPFKDMLDRAEKRLQVGTVIDVGSSDGQWSAMAINTWPDAQYLLVEANRVFQAKAEEFVGQAPRARLTWGLASVTPGKARMWFHADQPYQGVELGGGEELPVVTLDDEVERLKLLGPYVIKLDVHGCELAVLEGARRIMPQVAALIVEVYTFQPCLYGLRFWEIIPILQRYGFQPTDLCMPLYRPSDGRLGQVDMLFERSDAAGMLGGWDK